VKFPSAVAQEMKHEEMKQSWQMMEWKSHMWYKYGDE
jgi:hypothetical protein